MATLTLLYSSVDSFPPSFYPSMDDDHPMDEVDQDPFDEEDEDEDQEVNQELDPVALAAAVTQVPAPIVPPQQGPNSIPRAAQAVMSTPELVLAIIRHLDPIAYPFAQNINRLWSDVIRAEEMTFRRSTAIMGSHFVSRPRVVYVLTAFVLQYPPLTQDGIDPLGERKPGRDNYQFVFSCQAGRSQSMDSSGTSGSSGRELGSSGSNGEGSGFVGAVGGAPAAAGSTQQQQPQLQQQSHIHFHGESVSSGGIGSQQHYHQHHLHLHHHRNHEPGHENALDAPSLQALGHTFQSSAIIPNIFMRSAVPPRNSGNNSSNPQDPSSPLPPPMPFVNSVTSSTTTTTATTMTATTATVANTMDVPIGLHQSPSIVSPDQLGLQESLTLQSTSFSSSTSSTGYHPHLRSPRVRVVPCPYDYGSESSSSMSYEDNSSFLSNTSPRFGPGAMNEHNRQGTTSSTTTTMTASSSGGSGGSGHNSGGSSGSGSFSEFQESIASTNSSMSVSQSATSIGTMSSSSSVATAVPMPRQLQQQRPQQSQEPLHSQMQHTGTGSSSTSTVSSNPSRHWNVSMQSFFFQQAGYNAMVRACNNLLRSTAGRGCILLERQESCRIVWNDEKRLEYIWTVTPSLMDRTNPNYVEQDYAPDEEEDDEEDYEEFNEYQELSTYIDQKWNLKDAGFNYNLLAVFGSQSTGKSTLLNRLFGTNFDVMSESSRQQTTKGIWISKGEGMKVLIMDVEGTDGRERGEDQDFERKSALFSLATSEVLIVNMWEHQVGLYNGANMGLLKTVFEVNLQLFGSNRGFTERSNPDYVFKPQYSKRVPVDGLHVYAESIWEKIMTNKDLDLPTQQELLAQFRCDEIANLAFSTFKDSIKGFRHPIESGHLVEDLGPTMKQIRDIAIKSFDKDASRYHSEVYKKKRAEVLTKANSMLESFFVGQLKNLHKKAVGQFSSELQQSLKKEGAEFGAVSATAKQNAITFFLTGAKAIKLDETDWEYEEEQFQLDQDLQEFAATQREKELSKMLTGLEKQIKKELEEPVKLALDHPGPSMWGRIITAYHQSMSGAGTLFDKKAKTFELGQEEQQALEDNLKRQGWVLLTMKVQEESVDGLMLYKLLNRFEEKFQRDERGLPRVWKPDDDIDTPFRKARDETLGLIPLYSNINNLDPATGEEFTLESTDDFDFDQSLQVLSETRQQELSTQLRRKTDASFVEAKRSVVSTQAKIPPWVGAALIILGWNEFMAILMNPLYLSLTMILGVPLAVLWYLDMLTLVQRVAWKAYEQAVQVGTAKIRNVVHHQQNHPVAVPASRGSSYQSQIEDDSSNGDRHLLHRHSARSLSSHGSGGRKDDDEGERLELRAFEDKKSQ
ncbi:Dynamin-like GTPase that mediates homotypic ER fusion [Gryganskiella cystojenkinii]|nr:Dynamin-like GTPase that mediates homotypic ER fusion [Gryganskiella cystojenkinii]